MICSDVLDELQLSNGLLCEETITITHPAGDKAMNKFLQILTGNKTSNSCNVCLVLLNDAVLRYFLDLTAFFHLRNIAKLRNMLSVSDAEKLVHAFMTSRLDYCNALLGVCPASSINKLQIVQNAASRVLTRSRKYDHITQILQSLHWLPIKFRISYKILLLSYKALNDLAPVYLTNLLSRYNPTRSLRSQNSGLLVVPRLAKSTKGGRTFSYLAPKLWNSLPDNVRGSDTLSLFKSRLKTHLFSTPSIHIMHLIILYCQYI